MQNNADNSTSVLYVIINGNYFVENLYKIQIL